MGKGLGTQERGDSQEWGESRASRRPSCRITGAQRRSPVSRCRTCTVERGLARAGSGRVGNGEYPASPSGKEALEHVQITV